MAWNTSDIPPQAGRTAIVTGANAGIGYETALALTAKGAHVVLACRSGERGEAARRKIEAAGPSGSVELLLLDLASFDSVRSFAAELTTRHDRIDLLVNNAGVMVPPPTKTREGFELQIGVNFLGHFLLTGLLIDGVTATEGSRIVTVSSLAHWAGRIDFGNFRGEKGYFGWREYSQSKLADLVFALELDRRLRLAGHGAASIAAHPGLTRTELQRHHRFSERLTRLHSNNAAVGALPTLFAATAPKAPAGGYFGPGGFAEIAGCPRPAKVARKARNRGVAERLWEVAEVATGVRFLS